MSHPHLIHLEAVEAESVQLGEMDIVRRGLGHAAGTRRVGLSHYEIAPGARMMPAHVHGDEEEICFVLRGDGLSWQDGRTYRVGPGDTLVHREGAEAHTMIAGPGGLEVLMFGEGSRTGLTYLPRPKLMWAAPRWIPPDGPSPWKAEAAAGPLEIGEPEAERSKTIVALADVEVSEEERPGYRGRERNLARAAGSVESGVRHIELVAGDLSCPPHWHTMEEELFVVLEGDGVALLGDEEHPIRAGSILARPPSSQVAHALRAGDGGLTYLAYGTRVPGDICFYPRSNKLNIYGLLFRIEPISDYWDGEE